MACAGMVVILNGAPHCKKQAIIKQFQQSSHQPFFTLGMRDFYTIMRANPNQQPLGSDDEQDSIDLTALHAAITGMAKGGCHIIIDHCITLHKYHQQLQEFLHNLDVTWVEVTRDEILRIKDEQKTGSRPEGSSLTLAKKMITKIQYNLQLDSSQHSPKMCADKITQYLLERPLREKPASRWVPLSFPKNTKTLGQIILIAGTTSAGKSTLCKTLQQKMHAPCIQFGIDNVVAMLAPKYLGIPVTPDEIKHFKPKPEQALGFYLIMPGPSIDNPYEYATVQLGTLARLALSAHFHAIKFISQCGINVISDQVFSFKDEYLEAKAVLEAMPTFWVAVNADNDTLLAHEKKRGNRFPGHTLGLLLQMHKDIANDLELDSEKMTPEEEAEAILHTLKQKYPKGSFD
ncbi:phosphotransferase-like protein [Shewanella surugensis]|uniref:AAA family ATPase n=1 Tax=Shewanella surugensis TaxID=212020 RepID=A0ABT0LD27_9GAMM|nr:hypothetical protein [Shewanella surugensis]MCL1125611.1 hypothetical protein [Shewanella surugensis]